ncbi:DUF397 domain-containing protein [Streptomyces sp. ACT015]|uniref:DUF397 domain-containing protein n=1 Tax=Streptomyces sp. ACT015 TaxID=3134807 RepID=UPI003D171BFE
MRVVDLSNVTWRKSSYSNATGGDCLELVGGPYVVPVRDSKDVGRAPLVFGVGAWSVFAGAVKRGDLFE